MPTIHFPSGRYSPRFVVIKQNGFSLSLGEFDLITTPKAIMHVTPAALCESLRCRTLKRNQFKIHPLHLHDALVFFSSTMNSI